MELLTLGWEDDAGGPSITTGATVKAKSFLQLVAEESQRDGGMKVQGKDQ